MQNGKFPGLELMLFPCHPSSTTPHAFSLFTGTTRAPRLCSTKMFVNKI